MRVFCLDLPQSDACFIKAYPAETTEAFLEVSAFAFFCGVPISILYDNLEIAVARDPRRTLDCFAFERRCPVFKPFDWILIMCAAAGLLMVLGSIVLLYTGAIQLSGKNTGHALEAEFKNQLKVNVRNPALGLFAIGFAFFGLALYFAKPESEPLVIRGHIKIADTGGIVVMLKSEESLINVTSEGEIFHTIQPVEHLSVVIEAPGYRPPRWSHQINPDEVNHGRIEIHPEFMPALGIALTKPKPDTQSQSIPMFNPTTFDR